MHVLKCSSFGDDGWTDGEVYSENLIKDLFFFSVVFFPKVNN